jgi:hypothetical protein
VHSTSETALEKLNCFCKGKASKEGGNSRAYPQQNPQCPKKHIRQRPKKSSIGSQQSIFSAVSKKHSSVPKKAYNVQKRTYASAQKIIHQFLTKYFFSAVSEKEFVSAEKN